MDCRPHPTRSCALVRHLCVHKDMHNLCVAPVPLSLSHNFYKVKGESVGRGRVGGRGGAWASDYQITFWHAFLVFASRASNATLVPNSLAIMCLLYAFLSCKYAELTATCWPKPQPQLQPLSQPCPATHSARVSSLGFHNSGQGCCCLFLGRRTHLLGCKLK